MNVVNVVVMVLMMVHVTVMVMLTIAQVNVVDQPQLMNVACVMVMAHF